MTKAKKKATAITLVLDADDAKAVEQAIRFRAKYPMPDGESNEPGAHVAEICRGWLDTMGKWKWTCATGKPAKDAKPVRALKIHRGQKMTKAKLVKTTRAKVKRPRL